MRLVSKYPTGTRDSVGHLFVKAGEMRIMMSLIAALGSGSLSAYMLEMYAAKRKMEESPWSMSRCLLDINATRKLVEEWGHVMVDFLPEHIDKSPQEFFVTVLSHVDDVKNELLAQQEKGAL
jgi:hypothetical protein